MKFWAITAENRVVPVRAELRYYTGRQSRLQDGVILQEAVYQLEAAPGPVFARIETAEAVAAYLRRIGA